MSETDQVEENNNQAVPGGDEQLLEAASVDNNPNLNVILNIPVQMSLELGSTKMDLRELLSLGQGSVVELERMIDEPLDVLVNGALVAHGEVVVVDNKFGIRLTDIISPEKLVQNF